MIVFTDLDGTLIDFETYSFELTAPRVKRLLADGISVVFCSSKTRIEQQALMRAMGIDTLGIVENGSGIYVPAGNNIFPHHAAQKLPDGSRLVEFGQPAANIRDAVQSVSGVLDIDLRPYSALDDNEIANLTGLTLEGAARARDRDFSETLTAQLEPSQWLEVQSEFAQHDLQCLCGGRFYTVSAEDCNKGTALKAVVAAAALADSRDFELRSIAIGDSFNDVDMLVAADFAYLVQKSDEAWHDVDLPGLHKIPAIGPAGWLLAIVHALERGHANQAQLD